MMNKFKEIKNCTYLRTVNGLIFYDIDEICYMNGKQTDIPVDTILFTFKNSIFFYEDNILFEVLSDGTVQEIFNYKPSSCIEPIDEYFLVYHRISRTEKYYKLVTKEKKELWKDSRLTYNVSYNNLLLFQKSKFSKIDIQTGASLWSYTCPEGRKIEGNLYTYEDILVFIEKDDKAHTTLVGLDLQTGNILYKVAVGLINYRQQANKLYGFASNSFGDNTYLEIDITKGGVYEKSFPNYKRDVTGGLFTIKDDYLYYSIFKEGSIGVIDINKKEIIKEEKLDIKEGVQIGAPVVTEDKIYILDSENVLHIYERD
ncbi:hypothetical protein KRX57_06035 [Weeksellaceae bacterium TAE3-ERU29]|nr:hypothetical protein [Weeksellaceae bacterium TAE3-ERU29]